MAGNDSGTGGYLSPAVASPPLEDDALTAIFQQMIVGITALPGNMVRPRWQPNPPKQPEPTVNWCALGVSVQTPDDGPAIVHNGTGNGSDTYIRHEQIDVLASFYGPNAMQNAQLLSDGLAIPQNLEQLKASDMNSVDTGQIRAAPDLINEQWVRRFDIQLTFRRKITRTYAVLNILTAQGTVQTDKVAGPISSQ
ncbi:phage neck terminator protein [Paraburkholderia graminis]|uniref:phage neck terminator protein n=1 Tax=Paraburkholderia graminis TaxID=60548 RepID=UPI0038BB6984